MSLHILPHREVIAILRDLGRRLVGAALVSDRRPRLYRLIAADRAANIAPLRLREWSPPEFKVAVDDAINGQRSPQPTWSLVRARVRHELRGTYLASVPDTLWSTLAVTAWSDVTFTRAVATSVGRVVADTFLFAHEPPPVVRVTPQTVWILIALTHPGAGRLEAILPRGRLAAGLHAVAESQATGTPWSGDVWNEFIIVEALVRWFGDELPAMQHDPDYREQRRILLNTALRSLSAEVRRRVTGFPLVSALVQDPHSGAAPQPDAPYFSTILTQYDPAQRLQQRHV